MGMAPDGATDSAAEDRAGGERNGALRNGLLVDWGGVLTTNLFDSFKAFCVREGIEPQRLRESFGSNPDFRDENKASIPFGRWGARGTWRSPSCSSPPRTATTTPARS